MENNREKIYNFLKDKEVITTTNYSDWEKKYFTTESGVIKIFNFLTDTGLYTLSINDFYLKYCCDLSWAKNTQYCGGNNIDGNSSTDWLKDPTGSKKYVYQFRNCKWIAKNTSTDKEFNISDNPKYQSSIDILNKSYPNSIKDCNKPSQNQSQPDNQNVVTGGGQQPNQPGSTTSTGSQSGVNQSQGLGTSNTIDLGLDEIDKLLNPVRTENQQKPQVPVDSSLEGVPTTQQESIEVNTNVLKEEFYSTLKKIS